MSLLFLTFIILILTSADNIDNDQITVYETIKQNFEKNRIDPLEAYMQTEEFLRVKNNTDKNYGAVEELKKAVIIKISDKAKEEFEAKNYLESVKYLLSLKAIDEKMSVDLKEIYINLLKQSNDASDNFTSQTIMEEMADYKLLSNEEIFNFLKKEADANNSGIFLNHLDKYSKLYPDLLNEFPELNNIKEKLINYSNLNLEEIMNSVVTVILDKGLTSKRGSGTFIDRPMGTGFFINKNGYILTNHHVIADHVDPKYEGYSKVYVTLKDDPNKEIPAVVVGYDKVFDIALLKIPSDNNPYLILGSSSEISIGDKIYTIGNPLGIRYTVTSGIISNKDLDFFQLGKGFMIDAAINPGNSGGPLIDVKGQVVGIVFAGVPEYEGINFAIPFQYVKKTIPLMFKGNEAQRCWVGGALYENKGKVFFYYIMPNQAADKSGIEVEDRLLKIDGVDVKSVVHAQSLIAWQRYPRLVELIIERKGQILKKVVRLDNRPFLPVEKAFAVDTQKNLITLIYGIGLEPYGKNIFIKKYKTTKIYKGMFGSQLNIGAGDPLIVIDLKYLEKDKLIKLSVSYKESDMKLNERIVTVVSPAEIDSIL